MRLVDDLHLRQITSGYEQQLELCERHQEEREISILQLRDVKHNMKNNLISILAYAENREYEKIIKFVNEIMEEGGMTISPITNSGNIVIDSLIGYWYVTAQKQEIDFSVNMNIPMKMPFKGADICLIIGNLLENAVEAAKKVVGKKYIKVQMKYDKGNFLFFVKNNYNGKLLKTKNDRLRSTKLDAGNHGLGCHQYIGQQQSIMDLYLLMILHRNYFRFMWFYTASRNNYMNYRNNYIINNMEEKMVI